MEAEFLCVAGVGEKTQVRRSGEMLRAQSCLLARLSFICEAGCCIEGGGEGVMGR